MFSVPDHFTWGTHIIEDTTLPLQDYSSTCATCNRNCTYYKLHIFDKIEVVDYTQHYQCSSSFVLHTLSWCQIVVRFSRNWEHLTVIKLILAFQEAFQEDLKYSDFF